MKKGESLNQEIEEQLVCPACRNSFSGLNFCPECGESLLPASEAGVNKETKSEFDDSEDY